MTNATRPRRPAPIDDRRSGPLAPGTMLGDWRLEHEIGLGGMATVYLAVHALIGKRAAIKVMRAEATTCDSHDQTVHEGWLVNQIEHANVIDVFHIGRTDDGRPYLVMELLHGQNLGERMRQGRVPAVEAIDILLGVCAGLAAAHRQGVVHRDLKPDNIFLVDGAAGVTVKLVDWGIAKLVDPAPTDAMPPSELVAGTPMFMSPEQSGGHHVDGRSDLYALGVVAYELFLEATPFSSDDVRELLAMHQSATPTPPTQRWSDIPVALDRLLRGLLAKLPEHRPAIAQVIATLGEVRAELVRRAQPPRAIAAPIRIAPPPTKWRRVATFAAAVAVALAASSQGPEPLTSSAAASPAPDRCVVTHTDR